MKHIKNIVYMLSVQLVNYAFPLITIPIVSRVFGPEKIGLINYIAAIVGYYTLVVSYSFNFTGVRRLTRAKEKQAEIFSTIFTCQLILLTLCVIIFTACLHFIVDLHENLLVSVVTFTSCIAALFTQNWFLQAHNDFKLIAKISFISKLLSFVLILLLIKDHSAVLMYVAIINGMTLIVSITMFLITVRKYNIKLRFSKLSTCLNYLNEDKYLFFSSIVTSLYTTTGIILLGSLGTKVDVGYYSSAQKVIDTFKSVVMLPISQIIFPILSEKFGRNKEEGINTVKEIMPAFILLSMCTLVFILLFSEIIIELLFGALFLPSVNLLSILSIGLFAVFFGTLIGGQVMLNLGLDKAFLKIQIIISILSLAINIVFIGKGGAVITAWVWTLSEIIITLYQVIYLRNMGINILSFNMLLPSRIKGALFYVLKRNKH